MIITDEDRQITEQQANRIDQACALTDTQRRVLNALTELRAATEEPELRLGQHVRRFFPPEIRAATKKTATVAATHAPRIAHALTIASAAATTAALTDTYVDGYNDDEDESAPTDDGSDPSTRLGALVAGAATYAPALIGWLADNPTQDPSTVADRVASDAVTSGAAASTLDTIESGGGSQYRMVPESGACQTCTDAAGTYDLDDDSGLVPIHGNCTCSVEPVGAQS